MKDGRWVQIAESRFAHEQQDLDAIKESLPDAPPFRAWANFEFRYNRGRWNEVDLLVLARDTLYLIEQGFFEADGPFMHIGPEAERRFGRRYFSDLTAVFTAPPEFVVLAGRVEVGSIGTDLLTESVDGPRLLLLGRRSWKVTHVDWERRRCQVEAVDRGGKAKWSGVPGALSYELSRGMREVLLGAEPSGVVFTSRAATVLANLRGNLSETMSADRLVIHLPGDSAGRWWTWAGQAANRTLQASLPSVIDPRQRLDEKSVRLMPGLTVQQLSAALNAVEWRSPEVDANALQGLKFSAALPQALAIETLSVRLGDLENAQSVVTEAREIIK